MKKAWCKTAQMALDHIADGCELVICLHHESPYDTHGYVWHAARGQVTRFLQDSVAQRLVGDGYVAEVRRVRAKGPCDHHHYSASGWSAYYRAIEQHEDMDAIALLNQERNRLFDVLIAIHAQQSHLSIQHYPSVSFSHVVQSLNTLESYLVALFKGESDLSALPQEICEVLS